jgi:hypothetical protein
MQKHGDQEHDAEAGDAIRQDQGRRHGEEAGRDEAHRHPERRPGPLSPAHERPAG